MATQTERRKSTISQNRRPGPHKNSGSYRRREILKRTSTKTVGFDRDTEVFCKRSSSVPDPPYSSGGLSVSSPIVEEVEIPPKGFEKSGGEFRNESECWASPYVSCLIHAQSTPPRCVASAEFTAPQMQRIFRTAYRITGNREDAEDAMQDACLQAILHLQDFDGRSKFSTWLTRITINSSLMILRKRRNARIVSLNNADDFEESKEFQEIRDPTPDAEKRCLQKERETALRDEINALRPPLKDAIALGQLRGCSLRETAEIMGLSVAAVKGRMFHARRTLRTSRRLRSFFQRPIS